MGSALAEMSFQCGFLGTRNHPSTLHNPRALPGGLPGLQNASSAEQRDCCPGNPVLGSAANFLFLKAGSSVQPINHAIALRFCVSANRNASGSVS